MGEYQDNSHSQIKMTMSFASTATSEVENRYLNCLIYKPKPLFPYHQDIIFFVSFYFVIQRHSKSAQRDISAFPGFLEFGKFVLPSAVPLPVHCSANYPR